ncbi:MAG: ATP-grasp domain-containing protein [Planctomycetota bacterium]
MHVFLYEWVTGGGMLGHQGALPESLLVEGLAMAQAVAEDARRVPGWRATLLRDLRVPQLNAFGGELLTVDSRAAHDDAFARLCREADAVLLIAPEIDGDLLRTVGAAEAYGAKLASPNADFVELASNKHRTAAHLARAGVPVVDGILMPSDEPLPAHRSYPAVIKPNDGAGSGDIYVVAGPHDTPPASVGDRRVEPLIPGTAASVAALSGPDGSTVLPPCRQRLSIDGRLRYLGGATPLPAGQAARAADLARRVVQAMPPTQGYFGIDLVLDPSPDGAGDRVIEVNPRLTTSYTGLRFAVCENLAERMVNTALGTPGPVTVQPRAIEFGVDGTVSYTDTPVNE